MTKEECIDFFIENNGCGDMDYFSCDDCYFLTKYPFTYESIYGVKKTCNCYIGRFLKLRLKSNQMLYNTVTHNKMIYDYCMHYKLKKVKRILK